MEAGAQAAPPVRIASFILGRQSSPLRKILPGWINDLLADVLDLASELGNSLIRRSCGKQSK
jgi:hypothetical protein